MYERVLSCLVVLILSLFPLSAYAGNIDPGSKFAWGENVGWINFEPSQGPGITVTDTGLSGYAWGENIGWINLSPAKGGVVNDGAGNLSGYAWGENVGWINFYGVFIHPVTGEFSGYAWGENIGWISFAPGGIGIKTSWRNPQACTDSDSDGYALEGGSCGPTDCNDNDPLEHPNQVWYADVDNDGYSNGNIRVQCMRPVNYKASSELTATSGDCDDRNLAINPGAAEVCDALDNNCDGRIDEGLTTTYYRDADGDSYGDPATSIQACIQPSGYVTDNTDCDDNDSAEHPNQTWYKDKDNDAYSDGTQNTTSCTRPTGYKIASELTATSGDCNDMNPAINIVQGICGTIDPENNDSQYAWGENVGWINFAPSKGPGVNVTDAGLFGYAWGENIGWINLSPARGGVVNDGAGNLSGYAWGENVGWINFAPTGRGVTINPATGVFSGYAWGENIGWINFAPNGKPLKTSWRGAVDADGDGYNSTVDCNDNDPNVHPGADDTNCDGVDNDCNGTPDDGYVKIPTTCGQGVCASTGQLICVNGAIQDTCTAGAPTGNDDNCNGIDENCNGTADENYVAVPTTCGIGACRSTGQLICSKGTELNTCTPGSPQPEVCDGIDNNCNGVVDENLIRQCGVSNIGACRYGEQTCINGSWGACVGNIDPTQEICDGIDNDCDGVVPSNETDTDGDGVLDCNDGCPNDPDKVEPGICGCGVADNDTDNDGILDCHDDCPDVSGPEDQNGCPYADVTRVTMRIIDLQRSGVCQWPNGQPKLTCELNLKDVQVKVFDREDPDFNSAYGHWPSRHLLDDIYEANIGILGVCFTNENGECTIGEDHPGKFLVIAKYQEGGMTVYTGKFKNFKWNRSGCLWHWESDDDDVDGSTPPEKITKHLHILKQIRRNGEITFLGGFREVVIGSQLDIDHPEYKVWQGEQELYPFVFTSEEDWDIDVCMSVPDGYRLVGIQDENEQVVSTTDCVHTFVAGESKVFLFDVEDVGSPEPDMSFSLTTRHEGKVEKVLKKITGMRKWNEEKIEKRVHTKIKKLTPKWQKRAKALLERIGKR